MSEPARAFPAYEDDNQAAPTPLRDWLSALQRYETDANGPLQAPAADNSPGGPRLTQPTAPEQAEDADISELMAENLMLKAKLQVEHDRQDALQSALAAQIRELREHIAQEMASLEELRAEQEAVQAEYAAFHAERDALTAERDGFREDRDLWRARAEALAKPLFQSVKA